MFGGNTRGKYWVTEPDAYLEPRGVNDIGGGGETPRTIIDCFQNTVEKFGDRNALALKRETLVNGKMETPSEWKTWTWRQYYDDCRKFGKTLIKLGVDPFAIVNILGFNSPEWFIANCGAIVAGCIAAGIYATNMAEACHYITEHSKAEILCVDNNKQLQKYVGKKFPKLKAIVIWEEVADPKLIKQISVPVYQWNDFLELGSSVSDKDIELRGANIKVGNCSTLIYTSGTTGPPKAVMISHDNVTWTTKKVFDTLVDVNHTDRIVSYLPLSHIAAQMIDLHGPMCLGCCTYFARPDALKGTIKTTLCDVRPTIFFGVPRVWEKFQDAIVDIGRKTSPILKTISGLAKGVGKGHCEMMQYGKGGGAPCFYGCAGIILNKIKAGLGLDQCKACFTAAAPISPDVLWYFASLDIPVYEVFGQSECTGPHTMSYDAQWKIGTCGRPLRGTVSKGDATSELCYAGRHIFMGYMYMPDKTAETIDDEGWLHSGDIGEFDEDTQPGMDGKSGFLRITGRIKELIITAGGENIPPVLIENEMKGAMAAVSNVMVIGDKRKFLSMLVSLKTVPDKDMVPTDVLAGDALAVSKEIGSSATTVSEAIKDPLWKAYIDKGVKTANSKTTSNAQVVNKWVWLEMDFCEKNEELTPTMKLKRNVVEKKYHDLIESIYA